MKNGDSKFQMGPLTRMLEEHKAMVALCSEASNIRRSYVPEIFGFNSRWLFLSDPLMKSDFCFRQPEVVAGGVDKLYASSSEIASGSFSGGAEGLLN